MTKVFTLIKEVPTELVGSKRGMALHWLLNHADKVEKYHQPKQRSIYRAYFDDGVGKGAFVFEWRHSELTPLCVYLRVAGTGWPGLRLDWLEQVASERMAAEFTKESL